MRFKYLNLNPLSLREEDCVCRAISLATNRSYAEIEDKLYYISRLFDCEELCVCCYQFLLNDVFKYESISCDGMTVQQFADEHPNGTFILRMNGHCSCLINDCIYDLWNCGEEILTNAWEVD